MNNKMYATTLLGAYLLAQPLTLKATNNEIAQDSIDTTLQTNSEVLANKTEPENLKKTYDILKGVAIGIGACAISFGAYTLLRNDPAEQAWKDKFS